ncbi:MAG: prepilin-type N-terminal cleavage/methylation domain-containing protein [Opitutaceae bacterium]|jgi:general secretion pathway protein I
MPRRRGFTLIEVVVALMIFGLTAVVLGGAYLNVLNSYEAASRSNVNDVDVSFARSQLLGQPDLPTAQAGAEFDDGPRHIKWTCDAEPTETTDLFTVTFTCVISDMSAAQPKTVVETFMLVRPTWSDPTARTTLRQNAASRIALAQGRTAQ